MVFGSTYGGFKSESVKVVKINSLPGSNHKAPVDLTVIVKDQINTIWYTSKNSIIYLAL